MIRILHVLNWFRRGGLETLLLRILRDYDRSRFHMDACCMGADEGYLADKARSYGAEILTCPKSARFYSFSRRFARLLEGKAYDIVHAHADTWAGPLLRGAHRAGVPVRIAHTHSAVPVGLGAMGNPIARIGIMLLVRWGRIWVSRHATQVYGVSRGALDANWPGWTFDPERFGTWTGGVDTRAFRPRRGAEGDTAVPARVLVFTGSLLPAKNHSMLLEVFGGVVRRLGGAVLRLVGEGPERRAIERAIAARSLTGKVELLGLRDDVPDILASAALFVSCSKVEGLPIAVLEAQAAGVPVVASDIPPHREALAPELHRFLFPLDDPEKACDSVLTVMKDAALRQRLGESGRRFVAERFDSGAALDRLQDMYERWVGQSPATSRP